MTRVLIVYHSRTGHTEAVADKVMKVIEAEGLEVECKPVDETVPEDLLAADGIIAGSPTYYGTMAAELKKLFDDSVKFHSKLDGKAGAAFATASISGQETTVLSIIQAMLVHGMVVQGNPSGCHYGVVVTGNLDNTSAQWCQHFGERFAELVKRLNR